MTQLPVPPPPALADVDLKAFLGRYLRLWPLVAVAGIILLALVALIVVNVQPSYPGSTSIVILTPMRHDDPNRMVQPQEPSARTDKNYYVNEQLRITSQPIMRRVVDRLGLRTKYVQEGVLLDWDVYKDSPIQVELDTTSLGNLSHVPYGVPFYLHAVSGQDFHLVGDGKYGPDDRTIDVDQAARFGEWIKLDSMRVRITRVPNAQLPMEGADAYKYGFIQYDPQAVTLGLMAAVTGEPSLAEATTVNVTYTGSPKRKVLDILNAITEEYTAVHLAEQHQDLEKTIETVEREIEKNDLRLSAMGDSLERFKEGANITNLDHSTILLQEGLASLDKRREALSVQFQFYNNLSKQLTSGDTAKPSSPRSFSITDPLLNDMTANYAKLQSDIAMLRKEGKTANPSYARMVKLLDQQRETLLSSVESLKENTRFNLQNLDGQRNDMLAKQRAVPKLGRVLMDQERDQRTQEAVTQGLLKRLSDLHVQRAALSPEVAVTIPAYLTSTEPAFPNLVLLLIVAVLLALLIPLGWLIARSLFSDKISGAADLAKVLPGVRIAAQVPYSSHREIAAFMAHGTSPAHIEMAKLAALLERVQEAKPTLLLVCGANGNEAVGTTTSRLAWMLAHRGNKVTLVRNGAATVGQAASPPNLTTMDATSAAWSAYKTRAQEDGTSFILVEGTSADMLAIDPQAGDLHQALVVCQPGKTTRNDLEKLSSTLHNGQLPPVLLLLDGMKDKALPCFGLARGNGESRLGLIQFLRYNWSRAFG